MAIADWPEDERPREKLLNKGPGSLSDAELLAILFRTGIAGKSAVDLARDLLLRFESLDRLLGTPESELREIRGFGRTKYVQLQAAVEFARRLLQEQGKKKSALHSPQAVRDYLRLHFQGLEREVFVCVFLDAQNRVIRAQELFAGTLTQTSVYPREIVKQALRYNAAGVILAHNHPSGVAEPSAADRALTRKLKDALELIDVRILDHFVVAGGGALSFAEHGFL